MKTLKNLAVAAASLVIFSNITHAQTIKANYTVSTKEPFQVKYIGDEGEYLVFEVSLVAPKTANSVFAIYDKKEGELYSSYYAAGSSVKIVKIEKTNNSQVLDFKMTIGRTAFSKSFAANTSVVETINVTETSVTRL